jgi:hypothetical protein
MAVLEMLAEVIRSVELLRRVALAELVHILQMAYPLFPILLRSMSWRHTTAQGTAAWPASRPSKLFTTVPASVGLTRPGRRFVERPVVSRQCRTRPGVTAYMERVLVTLGLVLVLETIGAVVTSVLFLSCMCPGTS